MRWQKQNKYYKKKFSILGDSISTLDGYNPIGYNLFYQGEICEKSGVRDVTDTWWGMLIDYFGGKLVINNSWSGSRVTRLPGRNNTFPSGCSSERTGGLHSEIDVPDVIIVYLGTNDWANGVRLGDETTDDNDFRYAYTTMLKKLKQNYPNAEIWCCTLNTTCMYSERSFSFPYSFGGTHIEKYNEIIKQTTTENNCKVIDLYSYHTAYDAVDGTHPTSDGMNMLATMMIQSMDDGEYGEITESSK